MSSPENALAAVVHPDPYPFYVQQRRTSPLAYDRALGCWVAYGADELLALLRAPACAVRPAEEPIPCGLLGGAAEQLYSRLARTSDGARHRVLRAHTEHWLSIIDLAQLEASALAYGMSLSASEPESIDQLACEIAVHTLARALGLGAQSRELTTLVSDFARCLAPGATAHAHAHGRRAAEQLLASAAQIATPDDSSTLDVRASALGVLLQAQQATRGLIANTVAALARDPALRRRMLDGELDALLDHVARVDPVVHNTRRWLRSDMSVGAQQLAAGDCVLLVPAASTQPAGGAMTVAPHVAFGAGAHGCPGACHARAIARGALRALQARAVDFAALAEHIHWLPSLNLRCATFGSELLS